MLQRLVIAMVLGPALLLAGCVTPRQIEAQREDLLASAGFVPRAADTPRRKELLRTLPPNIFVSKVHEGKQIYIFADPLVCGCLYVGDSAAYARYKQDVLQRRIASEQQTAAREADFDWGEYDHGRP